VRFSFAALSRHHLIHVPRWLNNEQSAADSANFMANVRFDGIDEDLTAPGTPWIYYGVRFLLFLLFRADLLQML
jgi:hypothetical protein